MLPASFVVFLFAAAIVRTDSTSSCQNHLSTSASWSPRLSSSSLGQADEKRAERIPICPAGCCDEAQELALHDRARGHLQQIARIAGVRVLSSIQALAAQVNGEIDFLLRRIKFQIRSYLSSNFPRLYLQTNETINELFYAIRTELFASKEIAPSNLEANLWTAVKKFFVQIFPPTFLCISMGPCRSVTANYSACLLRNSPKWQGFFGVHPERITTALANRIEQFRTIERDIAQLHRTVLEIGGNVTDRCLMDFTRLKYCPQCLAKSATTTGEPAAPCADFCSRVMTACWTGQTADWDRLIRNLVMKSGEFNGAFDELEHRVRSAIAQAVEIQSPAIAKLVLKTCGPLRNGAVRINVPPSMNSTGSTEPLEKPNDFPLTSAGMIKAFGGYIGWWQRLVDKLCSYNSANEDECWDGTKIFRPVAVDAAISPATGNRQTNNNNDDQERIEGSARPAFDSDDEDFDGSGSGQAPYQPAIFEPDHTDVHVPRVDEDDSKQTRTGIIPITDTEIIRPTAGANSGYCQLFPTIVVVLFSTVIGFALIRH